jgi:hypothetical protein
MAGTRSSSGRSSKRHWTRQSRRAPGDEAAWQREDARLAADQRDQVVADFITLLALLDGLVQVQAARGCALLPLPARARPRAGAVAWLVALLRSAYWWQHLLSGHRAVRFADVLGPMVGPERLRRIAAALMLPAD